MELSLNFNIIHSPKLLFTPRLSQAIRIIELSAQELFEYICEQIEDNPLLEFRHSEKSPYETIYSTRMQRINSFKQSTQRTSSLACDLNLSLKDYLLLQLHVSCDDINTVNIGQYLIDNINDYGYLEISLRDAAEFFNVSIKNILKTVKVLQSFDPPGICARNLRECLLIQLKQKGKEEDLIWEVVSDYLEDVAVNNIEEVSVKMNKPYTVIEQLFAEVKRLEPRPGRNFCRRDNTHYIVADITASESPGNTLMVPNPHAFPQIKINKFYRTALTQNLTPFTRDFIQRRLNNAVWLIKCINLRKAALSKAALYLSNEHRDLFEKNTALIPAAYSKAAYKMDISEYLLQKLVRGKYLQYRKGYIRLNDFFK